MTTKVISHEQAEKRFEKSLSVDNHGHILKVKWTGDKTAAWYRSTSEERDVFIVTCSVCGQDSHLASTYYKPHVNADGSIPRGTISECNRHFLQFRPDTDGDIEAEMIMEVTMKRGGVHEFWVAHYGDTDFQEMVSTRWKPSKTNPYASYKKDTRGKWHIYGTFASRDEAVGLCTKQKQKYELRGYGVKILNHTSSGYTPPTATVTISVKKLINDYKDGLRSTATPIEVKEWLVRVDDALTNMEVLQALRDEVQDTFERSLEL